jgi:PEP-CTERM motif
MTPWKTSATVCLTGLALLSAPSRPLEAQVWLHLPNGGVGYVVDYLSTGTLFCTQWLTSGSCTSAGNSLVLSNGLSSMTVTFNGATGPATASSKQGTQVRLGTITTRMSGTGSFQFPTTAAPGGPYLYFAMGLQILAPSSQSSGMSGGYLVRPPTLRGFQSNTVFQFFTINQPPGAQYGEFTFGNVHLPTLQPVDADYDVMATVSLSPEPGTLMLMAAGLALAGGIAWRNRRKARESRG